MEILVTECLLLNAECLLTDAIPLLGLFLQWRLASATLV